MRRSMMIAGLLMLGPAWGAVPSLAADARGVSGTWQGLIIIQPAEYEVDFGLQIESAGDGAFTGRLTYPTQGVDNAPLESVTLESGKLTFVARDEQNIVSTFEGWLSEDGQSITGDLAENGQRYVFRLDRSTAPFFDKAAGGLQKLSSQGTELRSVFEQDRGKVRLLVILSPTCTMCRNGARLIQRYVLDAIPDPSLRVYVLWEPIGSQDNEVEARAASAFVSDSRVRHFWSEERFAGKAFQKAVGLRESPAWDVFLLFSADQTWKDEVPAVNSFMHNLIRENLPKERRLNGSRLADEIRSLLAGFSARQK